MATSFNIFKANELANKVQGIAACIDTEDYIHVCKVHDPQMERTVLISYIWDTRDITRVGMYYDDANDCIAQLNAMSNEELSDILANDNLTWLKVRNEQDLTFFDYIDFANREIMSEPTPIKFSKSTETNNRNELITKFMLNGINICMTKRYDEMLCSYNKRTGERSLTRDKLRKCKSTSYYIQNLMQVFGLNADLDNGIDAMQWFRNRFADDYHDTATCYTGSAITAKALKELISNNFNVKFI